MMIIDYNVYEDSNVVLLNTRGLRETRKRRKLFHYLHNHNYDVIFLQESHSVLRDQCYWSNEWGGKIILSHGDVNSRGVSILFKPTFEFSLSNTLIDANGRFIIADSYQSATIATQLLIRTVQILMIPIF